MMDDSNKTRRSSIPILKQHNKTKLLQPFISLNCDDESTPQHVFQLLPSTNDKNVKAFKKSNSVGSMSHLEIHHDIVIEKLCLENKLLKEQHSQLLFKYDEGWYIESFEYI